MLSSLAYFHPSYMSLSTPHPIWLLADSPFEVTKAATVATMLSGRYVTDYHARHWSKVNPAGNCQLCMIFGYQATPGHLAHLLLKCPALGNVRSNAVSHWAAYLVNKPSLLPIISYHTLTPGAEGEALHMNLLQDPSACPRVISTVQEMGSGILCDLFYMARTWCYAHHLKRKRLLKLHNII